LVVRWAHTYKVVVIAIVLFWGVMMWSMLRREVFLPRMPRPQLGAPGSRLSFDSLPVETWMGIYFSDGSKVGYTHSLILARGDSPENGYAVTNQTRMQLAFLDSIAEVDIDARAEVDHEGRFERFTIAVNSGPASFRAEAAMIDNKMHFQVTTGGSSRTFVMDKPPDGLIADSMSPLLAASNLRPGVTYRADLLDPISFTSSKARVTLVERESIDIGDEQIDADRILIEYQGIETHAWVIETGEVVRVDTAMGLSMVREPREVAEQMEQSGRLNTFSAADMAQFAVIPSGVRISDAARVAKMTVRVDGTSLKELAVEDSSQNVIDWTTGTIEIAGGEPMPERVRPYPIDRLSRRLKKLTEPELLIESDDPEIVSRAESIVSGSADSWQAALALYDWVYRSVDKEIVFSVPSALDVLHSMRGDCNEHTILYVALARAAGLPAQTQLGVVYSEHGFYYHAWPEVYVGEWVRMDPTLGQPVADATHIKFVEGGIGRWSEILRLVGGINIEVTDIEYGEPQGLSMDRLVLETRAESVPAPDMQPTALAELDNTGNPHITNRSK